jgi:hypothetical protein
MPPIKGLFYTNQNENYPLLNATKTTITELLSTESGIPGSFTANYSVVLETETHNQLLQ